MAKWHKNRKQLRNSTYTYDHKDYIDSKKNIRYLGGDPITLTVLMNRCQNLIRQKHHHANNKPPKIPTYTVDYNWGDIEIKVYMKLITYDLFLPTTESWNYRDYFTVEIDETVPNNMVIMSTLDREFIETVEILNG